MNETERQQTTIEEENEGTRIKKEKRRDGKHCSQVMAASFHHERIVYYHMASMPISTHVFLTSISINRNRSSSLSLT